MGEGLERPYKKIKDVMKIKIIRSKLNKYEFLTTDNKFFVNGSPWKRQEYGQEYDPFFRSFTYMDLEVLWENMNFMEGKSKLKDLIMYKAKKDFRKGFRTLPVEGYEHVLCINIDMLKDVFGIYSSRMFLMYLISCFVVGEQREIFVITDALFRAKYASTKYCSTTHIRFVEGEEKGICFSRYIGCI